MQRYTFLADIGKKRKRKVANLTVYIYLCQTKKYLPAKKQHLCKPSINRFASQTNVSMTAKEQPQTKEQLELFYKDHATSLTTQIAALNLRNRIFLTAELTTFIAAIGFIVAYTVYGKLWLTAMAALMAVAYIAARRMDVTNSERIALLTARRTTYENELKYLGGDFSPFDDGRRYSDPQHPFTFDMDIFGPQSLFNRINRTVTTGGSDELARRLSFLPTDEMGENEAEMLLQNAKIPHFIEHIKQQHDKINRLAADEEMRTRFVSCRHDTPTDTGAVLQAISDVRRIKLPAWASSPTSLAMAWLSLGGFLATTLLSVFTSMTSSIPTVWGTMHLFVLLMICNKPLRAVDKTAGRLHNELKAYAELVGILLSDGKNTDGTSGFAGQDNQDIGDVRQAFSSLRRILDGYDRRGNVLGMILVNVFLLNDFFLVRRFSRWQQCHTGTILRCIGEVSNIDALISMATFRFNEPQAGSAEVVEADGVVYEARGLWHPFIGDRAVRNDFSIADSHYYIVTGANMAGKSTFLRSLGVNYILAVNGMPVFAEGLKVSLFSLFSSMRTSDDLAHGISYFNAELLRLRSLIAHCHRHSHTLIILDEILKGTNSLDKLNGSRMFLDAISRLPVTGVIATHDLELSRMADERPDRFSNRCFEIQLADKITYTYKITPGVARNQNATHLLKKIIEEV